MPPPFNSNAYYNVLLKEKGGEESAATGFYEPKDLPGRYPRPQIHTIAGLLAGKKLEYPAHRDETFAKAERKSKPQQDDLF